MSHTYSVKALGTLKLFRQRKVYIDFVDIEKHKTSKKRYQKLINPFMACVAFTQHKKNKKNIWKTIKK